MTPLAERVLAGEQRAAARLLRFLDDGDQSGIDTLRELYPHTGRARVLGLTGAPGSGKSTLTDRLISAYRAQGKKVGVLAIDPTSPFSGGAILGDRIRMQRHETDAQVFIRSLATRGALGGLSRSTANSIRVLDAFGCDIVLVETVGVGQDEIDIVREADTSLVVVTPGMGDDIQAIKAGILEIADLFVLNKADRDGADRTEKELQMMLELNLYPEGSWRPSIVRTVAHDGMGIEPLLAAIEKHAVWLAKQPDGKRTRGHRALRDMHRMVLEKLDLEAARAGQSTMGAEWLKQVEELRLDPYTAAENIVRLVRGASDQRGILAGE